MRAILTALGLMAFAGSALAAGPRFSPPSPLIDADAAKPGQTAFARTFSIGTWSGQFEQTRLTDVQKRFGGQIEREGDAGSAMQWLCYDLPAQHQRVWLSSYEINGGAVADVTMWGVAAPANSPSCAPLKDTVSVDGFMALGAAQTDITGRLGAPGLQAANWSAWRREAKLSGNCTEEDTLTVRTDKGKVVYISAYRTSSC
ncbi:hypothetical protein [Asticcacaulis solisilvae]|uniref:hypothetical protein n=1 Tax=Asticcacaulis solisilvae TaxID=1217274 RepID=UPI003FD6DDDF